MGVMILTSLPCTWQPCRHDHYDDVIMTMLASQITSLAVVYSIVYSGINQRKIKALRHWPLCGKFTGDRWISRTNGQLRGKCFHLMTSSWFYYNNGTLPTAQVTAASSKTYDSMQRHPISDGAVVVVQQDADKQNSISIRLRGHDTD